MYETLIIVESFCNETTQKRKFRVDYEEEANIAIFIPVRIFQKTIELVQIAN